MLVGCYSCCVSCFTHKLGFLVIFRHSRCVTFAAQLFVISAHITLSLGFVGGRQECPLIRVIYTWLDLVAAMVPQFKPELD